MPDLTSARLVELTRQYINADQLEDAVRTGQQAVALAPDNTDAYFLLGAAYFLQERRAEALECYARVLAAIPDHIVIDHVIFILAAQGAYEAIIPVISNCLKAAPSRADMWSNLCLYLTKAGQTSLAINAGHMAVQLQPDLAEAHWNLSQALLRYGQFAEGWAHYEWRRQLKIFAERNELGLNLPWWDGAALAGRHLLVIAEQGAGDTFQFIRFATVLKQLGGTVTVAAEISLLPVLASAPGVDQVVDRGKVHEISNTFDCQVYLLSLPHLLRLQDPSPMAPYLFPLPARIEAVAAHVQCRATAKKVGLVWAGNPEHGNDRYRSMPLQAFAPLGALPGIQWFSLQKGEAARQCQPGSNGFPIIDLRDHLHDFADTAAAISCLDLLICVDTSVAHLAGALGTPVWTILPEKDVDWRWLDGRHDSPWYPAMQLFHQSADRRVVVGQLQQALRQWQTSH